MGEFEEEFVDEIDFGAGVQVGYPFFDQIKSPGVIEKLHGFFDGKFQLFCQSVDDACIFHLQYDSSSVHDFIILWMMRNAGNGLSRADF